MSQENRLEKTNRINRLFDFYEPLLTEKQQMFLKYYFHDDFSLGEIASEFQISRQAVYEHIKRAEQVLEMYEEKLGLLSKYERRIQDLEELNKTLYEAFGKIGESDEDTLQHVHQIVNRLQEL
ncbi:putative DNA-binding protein [Paenibacillus polymyxa]|uniref:putative DNA-binding protein n=1 Tax=Paenibacillus polymyxa TaxID=1406 RepID=UPI002AB445CF|nr:putative DNA-binding protein [Paenibacillus polymyxa]MDY8024067.1 putative DNA-binding protein [Paenibacillus polymyxa]